MSHILCYGVTARDFVVMLRDSYQAGVDYLFTLYIWCVSSILVVKSYDRKIEVVEGNMANSK